MYDLHGLELLKVRCVHIWVKAGYWLRFTTRHYLSDVNVRHTSKPLQVTNVGGSVRPVNLAVPVSCPDPQGSLVLQINSHLLHPRRLHLVIIQQGDRS